MGAGPRSGRVEIDVLGPMTVRVDGREVTISAPKERAILSLLAIRSGSVVSLAELVDALWGDDPPPTAAKAVQIYISKVRRALPDGTIQTISPGYRSGVDPADVDAVQFERLLREARRHGATDPWERATILADALGLWKGPALIDLADQDLGSNEATRIWELRLGAEEERLDALLACGQHQLLVADLMASVNAQPFRERRWAQLMLALHRCGRRAEALRTYQRLRASARRSWVSSRDPSYRTSMPRYCAIFPSWTGSPADGAPGPTSTPSSRGRSDMGHRTQRPGGLPNWLMSRPGCRSRRTRGGDRAYPGRSQPHRPHG